MSVNNKSRGKYFEDKIANEIRQALNLTKKDIHRNISSGVALFESGDIWTPWPCIIECKYYKTFEVRHILEEKSYIINWLQQQIENEKVRFIETYKIVPLCLLVIGKPYHPSYCIMTKQNHEENQFIKFTENNLPRIETQNLLSYPVSVMISCIKEHDKKGELKQWQNLIQEQEL